MCELRAAVVERLVLAQIDFVTDVKKLLIFFRPDDLSCIFKL